MYELIQLQEQELFLENDLFVNTNIQEWAIELMEAGATPINKNILGNWIFWREEVEEITRNKYRQNG